AAIDWFVEHGYDKAMGARPMARLVQSTLKAPLANELLFGKLVDGGTAFIDVKDGKIEVRCVPRVVEPAEPGDNRPRKVDAPVS
ncbi:MAG: ATP-dependent Clp protease, ATP-binding subunit clpA, partial [Deltaproteobacteria bacterium]|nr:ATP-dependent Clp protease, ATP-binding subunit clpA [Deltaproteobacteria bacterium]